MYYKNYKNRDNHLMRLYHSSHSPTLHEWIYAKFRLIKCKNIFWNVKELFLDECKLTWMWISSLKSSSSLASTSLSTMLSEVVLEMRSSVLQTAKNRKNRESWKEKKERKNHHHLFLPIKNKGSKVEKKSFNLRFLIRKIKYFKTIINMLYDLTNEKI